MITKDLCTYTIIFLRQEKILRRTGPLSGEELRGEDGGEYLAVGWRRLGVAVAAGWGEGDVDAAPVLAAQTALDQPVFLQPVDQPGQRALAQVHRFGQLLGAEVTTAALGQPVENLELAHAEAVALAHLALERGAGRRVAGRDGPPGGHDRLQGRLGLAHRRSLALSGNSCNYINCSCI
jgi:hypothetical protein